MVVICTNIIPINICDNSNSSDEKCNNLNLIDVNFFYVICFLIQLLFYKSNNSHLRLNLIRVIVLPVLLVVLISNIQSTTFSTTQNIQDRLSSINIEEYSTNSRIRYFSDAIKSISKSNSRYRYGELAA